MIYRYENTAGSYEDYASGRVLYNAPGAAPFPVRLGSEIFLRCKDALTAKGHPGPHVIYDPFCGSGYLLTVLGLRHNQHIARIMASDINADMLAIARRNLGLLSLPGLDARIEQLERLSAEFCKESHREALGSAARFREIVASRKTNLPVDCFCADATRLEGLQEKLQQVDLVIADLPYGQLTDWQNEKGHGEAASSLLAGLSSLLPQHAVIATVADKAQQLRSERLHRLERFSAGKRQIALFEIDS